MSYYLHRKTGGIYRVVGWERTRHDLKVGDSKHALFGTGTADLLDGPFTVTDPVPTGEHVIFYINVLTGQRWARPSAMFHDGRFTQFERPPQLVELRGQPL